MTMRGSAGVLGLLAVLAGCARSTPPPMAAASSGSGGPAPQARFTLDVTLSLTGSRNAVLRTGDRVVSGDRINAAIKASVDAHLYVGYCDRDGMFTIYPPVGSIEARAGEITYAPGKGANITLDDQIGAEVLYVIGSRRRLDVTDPELTAALSRAKAGAAGAACEHPLQHFLEGTRTASTMPQPAPAPAAATRASTGTPAPGLVRSEASTAHRPGPGQPRARSQPGTGQHSDRLPPPANLERGAYITWGPGGEVSAEGDLDDIVVLRYSFSHVAR